MYEHKIQTGARMSSLISRAEEIAKVCHEANRAYCETQGDFSQMDWERAPDWQRRSAVKGVKFHLDGNHGPEASHENWLKEKRADGWKFGAVKDVEAKEHPCFRPYKELPVEQRRKDMIFLSIVNAFKADV